MSENSGPEMMPQSCDDGRPVPFKAGDWVRFAPEIPRPHGWVEMSWRIARLSSHWRFETGDIALAQLQARDGTLINSVDTRVLVPLSPPGRR